MTCRPSKCLQYHQQRWYKILLTGISLLLSKYGVLSLIDFWSKLRVWMVVLIYFYFSYSINCYYVSVLYSIIYKTVPLNNIGLNTSFCPDLDFDKIYALFFTEILFYYNSVCVKFWTFRRSDDMGINSDTTFLIFLILWPLWQFILVSKMYACLSVCVSFPLNYFWRPLIWQQKVPLSDPRHLIWSSFV